LSTPLAPRPRAIVFLVLFIPGLNVDRLAADRVADRDPARPPILVDAQTHV
jgi:hypothetical protein